MKHTTRLTLVLALTALLAACASEQKKEDNGVQDRIDQMPPVVVPRSEDVELEERLSGLQTQLGLSSDVSELGFAERPFDSCRFQVGNANNACGPRYFSVVHFRVQCRDTNETTEQVVATLQPLVGETMEWRLGGVIGKVRTDASGQGQVHLVTPKSTKAQRFILILGKKSLGVEAGDVTQIVVPQAWCVPQQ